MVMLYCIKYQVNIICVGTSDATLCVEQDCSSPIARPWTQWVHRLPVQVHIHACLYMYIMLCYAYTLCIYYGCINLKIPLSGPQNQHSNYIMCAVILHKTSWKCIRFLKVSCFQPQQFNRGNVVVVGYCKFFNQTDQLTCLWCFANS